MATGDGQTDWIDVTDFSGGIHSGTRSFQTGMPESALDGIAQVRDTWGCVANVNGGLEAGPALIHSQVVDWLAGATPLAGAPSSFRILDFSVTPKTYQRAFTLNGLGEIANPNDAVWVLGQYFTVDGGTNRASWRLYNLDRNYTPFAVGFGMAGEIDMVEAGRRWGTGSIEFYRDGGATPTTSPKLGLMVTFSHHDYNPAGGGGWKNTTRTRMGATLGSPYALADVPFRSAYHQQRNVFSVATPAYGGTPTRDSFSGALNEDAYSDEQLRYSPVLATPAINDTDRVFLVGDRPDQIGAMLSVNTNELYIIKAHSGGMIVNGALERPSVNRYPGVESTGSFPHSPVLVPSFGMVYGAKSGVFAWQGGNQSRQLSTSLDGSFWLTPTDTATTSPRSPQTPVGTFGYLYPYVFAPNNWIMDVRTGGWFRLHPPTSTDEDEAIDLAHYSVSSTGQIYAAPIEVASITDPMWVQFNPQRGATKYSWRSQPLARPLRGRQNEFRELNAVLSGKGDVTFTLIGINGEQESQTITVDHDRPHLFRKMFDLRAFDVEVLIQSEGTPTYLDDTYVIDGTLSLESAQHSGGPNITGNTNCSIAGAKYPQPMRISTGVTFSGVANVPGALPLPSDTDPGWTAYGVGATFPQQHATPHSGIDGGGIITAYFHRYDIQTSGGSHLGYLYKQTYYNASMQEVGHYSPNASPKTLWLSWRPIPGNAESGGGAFVGPIALNVSSPAVRVFNIGHIQPGALDPAAPQVAPAVHRFSLGYKASNAAERG